MRKNINLREPYISPSGYIQEDLVEHPDLILSGYMEIQKTLIAQLNNIIKELINDKV